MISNDYSSAFGGGSSVSLTPKSDIDVNTVTFWNNDGLDSSTAPSENKIISYQWVDQMNISIDNKQDSLSSTSTIDVGNIYLHSDTVEDNVEFNYDVIKQFAQDIAGKQPVISPTSQITIADVNGLQTSLTGKQPTISPTSQITIADVNGLQTSLNGKQPSIGVNHLVINNVAGLSNALNGKHPTISTGSPLPQESVQNLVFNLGQKQDKLYTTSTISINEVLLRTGSISTPVTLNANTFNAKQDILTDESDIRLRTITFVGEVTNPADPEGPLIIGESGIDVQGLKNISVNLALLFTTKQDIISSSAPISIEGVENLQDELDLKQPILGSTVNATVNNLTVAGGITLNGLDLNTRVAGNRTEIVSLQSQIDTLAIADITGLQAALDELLAIIGTLNDRITVLESV